MFNWVSMETEKLVCCLEKWKENQVIWFLCGFNEAKKIFWQMIKTRIAKATWFPWSILDLINKYYLCKLLKNMKIFYMMEYQILGLFDSWLDSKEWPTYATKSNRLKSPWIHYIWKMFLIHKFNRVSTMKEKASI